MGEKWENNTVVIKLLYRSIRNSDIKYHLGIPSGRRIEYNDWIKLVGHLRSTFPRNNRNVELYKASTPRWVDAGGHSKDQPVYEYACDVDALKTEIKSFIKTNFRYLDGYEISFTVTDYDYISSLMEPNLDMIPAGENLEGFL